MQDASRTLTAQRGVHESNKPDVRELSGPPDPLLGRSPERLGGSLVSQRGGDGPDPGFWPFDMTVPAAHLSEIACRIRRKFRLPSVVVTNCSEATTARIRKTWNFLSNAAGSVGIASPGNEDQTMRFLLTSAARTGPIAQHRKTRRRQPHSTNSSIEQDSRQAIVRQTYTER